MLNISNVRLFSNYISKLRKYTSDATKGLSKIIDDVNSREISQLTDVDIINFSTEKIYFKSYSATGFTLSNNFKINGGVTAFPKSVFFWNVIDLENIDEDSLQLLSVLEPKIDIVIIGKGPRTAKHDFKSLLQVSRRLKINFEILPTADALATFNFLNYEDRNVAAFLLPVKTFTYFEEDQADIMRVRRKNLDMFRDSIADISLDSVTLDKEFLLPSSIIQKEKPNRLGESIQSIAEEAKQLYIDSENNNTKKIESTITSNLLNRPEIKKGKEIVNKGDTFDKNK